MTETSQADIRIAIESKFNTLLKLTGKMPAVVVSGPAGIGKSYGVEDELKRQGREVFITKAGLSPVGLYRLLYENSKENYTLVIDDSDKILFEREGIDLLKAALDTNEPRRVQWNKQNPRLEKMGIPLQFETKGHIILITNLDLRNAGSKSRQNDFSTLTSRANYLDLGMKNLEEKLMRCQMVLEGGTMLSEHSIADRGMLFEYLTEYGQYFDEVSLRSLIHLGRALDFYPEEWESISASTLMVNPPSDAYQTFQADGSGVELIEAGLPKEIEKAEGVEAEVEPVEIKNFGDTPLVTDAREELIKDRLRELRRRIEIIDDFFLNKRFSERPKNSSEVTSTKEGAKEFIDAYRYKESLGLSQEQSEELYDFIIKIAGEIEEVSGEKLQKMVNFYNLSGNKWTQGMLAFFVSLGGNIRSEGVTISVQKRS